MSLRFRLETHHIIAPTAGWLAGTTVLLPPPPAPDRSRIAVYSALLSATANTQVAFVDDTGAAISSVIALAANTPFLLEQNANMDPWFITAATHGLSINVTAGGPLQGDVYWLQIPGDYSGL